MRQRPGPDGQQAAAGVDQHDFFVCEVRRLRNRAAKSTIRTFTKKAVAAAEQGDFDAAAKYEKVVQSLVDSASKGSMFPDATLAVAEPAGLQYGAAAVVEAGAHGIAVSQAVFGATDVRAAARRLRTVIDRCRAQ